MNLTKAKTTVLLGSAGLVLCAGLGWVLVLSPRQSELSEIQAQTVSAEAFNRAEETELAALRLQSENLGAQQEYADGLTARFPATAAQPQLFAEVQAAAARAGLSDRSVVSLTPSAPLPATTAGSAVLPTVPTDVAAGDAAGTPVVVLPPALASMVVEMTVTGPYDALLLFIAELENSPRAYLVATVDVAVVGEPGGSTYTLTLTGSMFVLPPLTDPAAG